MYVDLLSLVFTRLNQQAQVNLSQCSSIIFSNPLTTIIRLVDTEGLNHKYLEKKSSDGQYLWADLQELKFDNADANVLTNKSIAHLHKLKKLNIEDNEFITKLPSGDTLEELNCSNMEYDDMLTNKTIANLRVLKKLNITYNNNITKLPLAIADTLEVLYATDSGLTNKGIEHLRKLRIFKSSSAITKIPNGLANTLQILNVKREKIKSEGIAHLNALVELNIKDTQIKTLPLEIADTLKILNASGDECALNDSGIEHLRVLQQLKVNDNINITILPLNIADTLQILYVPGVSGLTNEGIAHLRALKYLNVNYNNNITELPLAMADTLQFLLAEGNSGLTNKGIAHLRVLKELDVRDNPKITKLPLGIADTLKILHATNFSGLTDTGIAHLRALKYLNISNNLKITKLPLGIADSLEILHAEGTEYKLTKENIMQMHALKIFKNDIDKKPSYQYRYDFYKYVKVYTSRSLKQISSLIKLTF